MMTTDRPVNHTDPVLSRARRMFVVVAIIVPVMFVAAGAVVVLAWLESFTAPVAIHWGVNGADGFGPAGTYFWLLLGIGLGVPLLLAVTTLVGLGASWGPTARLMGALAAGMSVFAVAISVGSLAIQRDLPDPADVPGIGGVMLLAFGGLVLVGGVAWFVQPRVRVESPEVEGPRRAVDVRSGERVVWVATTSLSRVAIILLVLLQIGLVVLAVVFLATDTPGGWVVTIVTVVVGLAVVASAAFRVRITPEGLDAHALLGWPRVSIPIGEITTVRAIEISPLGDFGGWGIRMGIDGRRGIVMRRGSAIEVGRRGRGAYVVTIDAAQQAAALLQVYVDREQTASATDAGE